nr:MAG TPA: hypothetical protein [Caudoviricetes sp.]DAZ85243.1 MAG TPA: hypothetical protein [Caudoviricetes sp.]
MAVKSSWRRVHVSWTKNTGRMTREALGRYLQDKRRGN